MACLEDRLKACEEKIADLMGKEKTMVAFSTLAEYGGARGPFDGDTTLVYNTLIANVGDAYSASTGVFTAPVAGVYCFILSYHAGGDHNAKLMLIKNSELIVATSDHKSNEPSDNGGNAAVLELKKGDQVYVRMAAGTRVWADGRHTSFSGFLVNQK
ncbi:complement C1q-like protein 4 isoform X3 [Lates calcarifer]|uniref:Complement C1q-like protein 4 isoform X2 n=1 Tax=Lates calcarifer TaxID=8187 RepID=A0AAJ8BE92_LATCA|nr:complement C1q-like protein 4 isoform X2 [Lates calcarifer]XP_050931430.1 complement C1q-like protein 4 isoform X3 [Lates calcarifer]